jgi:hypothetical protein
MCGWPFVYGLTALAMGTIFRVGRSKVSTSVTPRLRNCKDFFAYVFRIKVSHLQVADGTTGHDVSPGCGVYKKQVS